MTTKQMLSITGLFLFALLFASLIIKGQNTVKKSGFADQVPALLDRPEAIQMDKEWEHAQNYYSQARKRLTENGNDAGAKLQLARVFIQEARVTGEHGHYYPAALHILNTLLQQKDITKKQQFEGLTAKAAVLLSQHEFHKALLSAEKAMPINPYNAQVYGALVDAYVELGNYEKAVEYADKMVALRPDLMSYSRVSYLREIHEDIDGAIQAMKMAIAAGAQGTEHTAWARVTLGNIYEEKKQDLETAEAVYRRTLIERPNYPFALAGMASIEFKNEKYSEAERWLKLAIDAIPEVGFYIDLVKVYQKTGRQEDAFSLTGEILKMFEEDVASGHNMNIEYANFYLEVLNDPESALPFAKKEYKARPANKDVKALMTKITESI